MALISKSLMDSLYLSFAVAFKDCLNFKSLETDILDETMYDGIPWVDCNNRSPMMLLMVEIGTSSYDAVEVPDGAAAAATCGAAEAAEAVTEAPPTEDCLEDVSRYDSISAFVILPRGPGALNIFQGNTLFQSDRLSQWRGKDSTLRSGGSAFFCLWSRRLGLF